MEAQLLDDLLGSSPSQAWDADDALDVLFSDITSKQTLLQKPAEPVFNEDNMSFTSTSTESIDYKAISAIVDGFNERPMTCAKPHPLRSAQEKARAAGQMTFRQRKSERDVMFAMAVVKPTPRASNPGYRRRLLCNRDSAAARRKADETYRKELCQGLLDLEVQIGKLESLKARATRPRSDGESCGNSSRPLRA